MDIKLKILLLIALYNFSSYSKNNLSDIINKYLLYYEKKGVKNNWLNQIKENKISPSVLDELAIFKCKNNPKSFISILWPIGLNCISIEKAEHILKKYGAILHKKKINLEPNAITLILKHTYKYSAWIGTWDDNFSGIRQNKMLKRFPKKEKIYTIYAYLLEYESLNKMIKAKHEIRKFCGVGFNAIHATDNHEQAISLSKLVFNDNSINFINKANQKYLKSLDKSKFNLHNYESWLNEQKIIEDACVTYESQKKLLNSDNKELRFISNKKSKQSKLYLKHIADINKINNITYDPTRYFYYDEVKFQNK